VLNHIYLKRNNQLYKQPTGSPTGVPTSAILSEVLSQHLEHSAIQNILTKHKIINYFKYADYILIVNKHTHNNTDNVL
jgi:hypothetical protein